MPGSPPSSTSDPGTMPPPSTRSNSSMPVDSRSACADSTSLYSLRACSARRAARSGWPWPPAPASAARSSTSEFQRAALGAAAHPLGRLRAALLADEHDFRRFHSASWLAGLQTRPPTRQCTAAPRACPAGRRSPTESCRSTPPSRARRCCCHGSSPCAPRITTSSPGDTSSSPVTSTVIMSIDTAPTTGTRWPRISTEPRPAEPRVEAVGVAGRAPRRSCAACRSGSASRSRRPRPAAAPSPPSRGS